MLSSFVLEIDKSIVLCQEKEKKILVQACVVIEKPRLAAVGGHQVVLPSRNHVNDNSRPILSTCWSAAGMCCPVRSRASAILARLCMRSKGRARRVGTTFLSSLLLTVLSSFVRRARNVHWLSLSYIL